MAASEKTRSGFAGVFTGFIEETLKEFGYLVAEFGFEHFDTSMQTAVEAKA